MADITLKLALLIYFRNRFKHRTLYCFNNEYRKQYDRMVKNVLSELYCYYDLALNPLMLLACFVVPLLPLAISWEQLPFALFLSAFAWASVGVVFLRVGR